MSKKIDIRRILLKAFPFFRRVTILDLSLESFKTIASAVSIAAPGDVINVTDQDGSEIIFRLKK